MDDGNQPNDAAVAPLPVPREQREGAAPAGDFVDIAADILDAKNAVIEQDLVYRLPIRKTLVPIAPARPGFVFLGEMRMQRAVALRTDGSGKRVIVRLRVVADHLPLFLDEPLPRRRHEARRATEIVLVVLVGLVPAGIDDHHVARTPRGASGLFHIIIRDRLPFLFGNRDHDARAEEVRQWNLTDQWGPLHSTPRPTAIRLVFNPLLN